VGHPSHPEGWATGLKSVRGWIVRQRIFDGMDVELRRKWVGHRDIRMTQECAEHARFDVVLNSHNRFSVINQVRER